MRSDALSAEAETLPWARKRRWRSASSRIVGMGSVLALSAAKRGNKAVEVRIEAVQKRDLVASVTASGQVRPQTKVDVASDVSGKIIKLAVKEGQMVTAGPVPAADRSVAAAGGRRARRRRRSRRARAQLAQAQANLDQAQRSYDRSATIKKTNPQLISDEQLEQLRTAVDVNKALVEAAKHAVDQVDGVAQRREERARRRRRSTRRWRAASRGSPSSRVRRRCRARSTRTPPRCSPSATCRVLETRVKVDETDVARIKVGDSAQVQIDAFPDTTFIGRVTKISNSSVKAATHDVDRPGRRLRGHDPAAECAARTRAPTSRRRPRSSPTSGPSVLSVPIIALTVRENEAHRQGRHGGGAGQGQTGEGSRQEGRRRRVRGRHGQQSDLPARKSRDRRREALRDHRVVSRKARRSSRAPTRRFAS